MRAVNAAESRRRAATIAELRERIGYLSVCVKCKSRAIEHATPAENGGLAS